ncbi:MAG: hypothetical protein M3Y56_00130 [Armatimonadota bacterium]|nr:hypothetical protein [Armatimonadota bacterium]
MWLMTKYGFYSIVDKKPDEYHVRSRERLDLENLIAAIPLAGATIIETPEADYACRIIINKDTLLPLLSRLGETLDYSNFKSKIDSTPDQKHKPYHKVWDVLADALGAYGHKPGWMRGRR